MLILQPSSEVVQQPASTLGIARRVGLIHRGSHPGAQPLRQCLAHVALLVLAQRWINALAPNTSTTALCNAFAPSITTNNECSVSSPRSLRSASSALHAAEFSVAPSRSPSTCFSPWSSTPSAASTRCSPKCTPSMNSAVKESLPSSRLMSSANLRSVPYTNRSLTALLLTPRTLTVDGSGSRDRA